MSSGDAPRRPVSPRGRPRSKEAENAILDATIAVVSERGFRNASVDEIAARAHAGKDTMYRHWPTKSDLVHAALERLGARELELPELGSLDADLIASLTGLGRLLTATRFGRIVTLLVGEAPHHPEMAAWLHEFWAGRRQAIATLIRRGEERGDMLLDHSDDLLPDLLLGPVYSRWLAGHPPPDDAFVTSLVTRTLARP